MQAITNKATSYWVYAEDCVGAVNDRMNIVCDRFSNKVVLPALKASYSKVGEFAPALLANRWYDPIGTGFILRITKVIEQVVRWEAMKKAHSTETLGLPLYSRYLDRVLISGAQHLHSYIKEVNFLLSLPKTLKYYTTAPSFDRFIGKLPNFFGKSWVVVSKVIIASKYLHLNFVNLFLMILEIGLSVFALESLLFLIKSFREVIVAASSKLSAKVTEVAHDVINRREAAIRKDVTIAIANTVNSFVLTVLTRAVAKSVFGGAIFLGAKLALQSTLNLSDLPIDLTGLATVGTIFWKTILKPTWDPYYDAYNPNFDPTISHLREFCQRYDIGYWYPSLKTIQVYARETPE